jgi:hypothetical protein
MKNVQTIQRYIGSASDTKPTASSCNVGSTFNETDTKESYLNTGSSWVRNDVADYPYEWSVAEGLRSNHKTFFKVGFNSDVQTAAEDIWGVGGLYTFPATAGGMTVSSSNVGDTASGIGARTVKVYYLNASCEEKEETFSMTGSVTKQSASTDFYRINYFKIQTAGSTGAAIGSIDISASTGSPIYSRINVGQVRARDLIYTVPKDKELYLDEGNFGVVHTAANKYSLITVRSNYDRVDSATSSLFFPESTVLLDAGMIEIKPTVALKFPEKTDIRCTASSNGTGAISVAIRGILESE